MTELKEIINIIDKLSLWQLQHIQTYLNQKIELCKKQEEWEKVLEIVNKEDDISPFEEFINEMIIDLTYTNEDIEEVITEDTYLILLDDIMTELRKWLKIKYGMEKCPPRKEIKSIFNKKFPERNKSNYNNTWYGFKLKTTSS